MTDLAALRDAANGLSEAELRKLIVDLTGQYARNFHGTKEFVPGESPVPVAGKVYGDTDMQ
ncbi:MAG: lipopolysaccharide biosynthesis protein RfbH, partial [Sphingomonas sp.]|nr:lipopolysaccharide biosynthesis protein RfbH [Sphingomonas sp.]